MYRAQRSNFSTVKPHAAPMPAIVRSQVVTGVAKFVNSSASVDAEPSLVKLIIGASGARGQRHDPRAFVSAATVLAAAVAETPAFQGGNCMAGVRRHG